MFWAAVVVGLVFVVFTVVQIGRMAWRFLRGDEDLVSGDSFGWQLFGRSGKDKAP
jgi:hypothetical protein